MDDEVIVNGRGEAHTMSPEQREENEVVRTPPRRPASPPRTPPGHTMGNLPPTPGRGNEVVLEENVDFTFSPIQHTRDIPEVKAHLTPGSEFALQSMWNGISEEAKMKILTEYKSELAYIPTPVTDSSLIVDYKWGDYEEKYKDNELSEISLTETKQPRTHSGLQIET